MYRILSAHFLLEFTYYNITDVSYSSWIGAFLTDSSKKNQ